MMLILSSVPSPDGIRGMAWIIDFFDTLFDKWERLFDAFHHLFEGIGLIDIVINDSPSFIFPIATCVLAVAVIMWVVNLF